MDSEHPMGRRAYDDDLVLMLGRVEGTTTQILRQIDDLRTGLAEAEGRLAGRVTRVEGRLDVLEEMHAEERGATRERGRLVALVKTVRDAVPAGVLLAVYSVALHYQSGGGGK